MQLKVVKKNIMDEETRDEKEYLGPELFQTLQQYKAIQKLEAQKEAEQLFVPPADQSVQILSSAGGGDQQALSKEGSIPLSPNKT